MKIPIIKIPFSEKEIADIKAGVEKVLRSGMLTLGENVAQFEEKFAGFCGVKYAVAVNSCTAALIMALKAVEVENYTVIIPSNTYMATAIAAYYAGAKIILVDCNKETLQMDFNDMRQKVRDDTKAVILVHIGGAISPEYGKITKFCKSNKISLIEDAAHAHGSTINGKTAGSLGDAAAFSFFPTKVLTTGEGGMLTTNSKEIYEKAKSLRVHAKVAGNPYIHDDFSANWAMSEFQAVVGVSQMKKARAIVKERQTIAARYDKLLEKVDGVRKLNIPDNIKSSYYKYIVFLDAVVDRGKFKARMKEVYGVSLTGEVYEYPCHIQPVFKKYREVLAGNGGFPNTEQISKSHICLPLYLGLKSSEVKYVVDSLKDNINHFKKSGA